MCIAEVRQLGRLAIHIMIVSRNESNKKLKSPRDCLKILQVMLESW